MIYSFTFTSNFTLIFGDILFQISSLKMQIQSQESDLKSQEDDLNRAKAELNRLQQEETQLEQSIQAGKVQLETIIKSLKSTQEEINQVFTVAYTTSGLLLEHELERLFSRREKRCWFVKSAFLSGAEQVNSQFESGEAQLPWGNATAVKESDSVIEHLTH